MQLLIPIFITLRPKEDKRNFADDINKCILLKENKQVSIEMSLKFVPKGTI